MIYNRAYAAILQGTFPDSPLGKYRDLSTKQTCRHSCKNLTVHVPEPLAAVNELQLHVTGMTLIIVTLSEKVLCRYLR